MMINVQYQIEKTELDDNGTYTCSATSIYGQTNQSVDVQIKSIPLNVSIPAAEYIGTVSQLEIEIPCITLPETKSILNTKWYYNGIEIQIDFDNRFYKVMRYA